MATPKKPSKSIAPETEAPAKKTPRKRSAAKAAEAPVVDAAPTATPAPLDATALEREIRQRAYALYRAGSQDTLGNWLQAEREVRGS